MLERIHASCNRDVVTDLVSFEFEGRKPILMNTEAARIMLFQIGKWLDTEEPEFYFSVNLEDQECEKQS